VFKQGGLVRQNPIQAAIQPVLFRYREARSQQIPHGALIKSLPVQSKLTAR
jgi:ribosomal protein L35AE/L33A